MEPKRTSQAPIKVFDSTKEKVRLAAAVSGRSQAEIVESAVGEYLTRHAKEFAKGLERARDALLRGKVDGIAYLLDEHPEDIRRVAGSTAPKRR